ncbi:GspE/PulE family protein [Alienimonas sp. DA493]|uniref:GspE/PulE family protein n=1 Tax=Alienimonas sp. DA493 TaxID=3373605 RepID=UPI0037546D3D
MRDAPPPAADDPGGRRPGARWAALLRDRGLLPADAGDPPPGVAPLAWSRESGVTGDDEARAFAAFLDAPYAEAVPDAPVLPEFLERTTIAFARRHGALVLGEPRPDGAPPPPPATVFAADGTARAVAADGTIDPEPAAVAPPAAATLVLGSAAAWEVADALGRFLGRDLEPIFAPAAVVRAAIDAAYEARGVAGAAAAELAADEPDLAEAVRGLTGGDAREDLLDGADRAPVVRLVNAVLLDAARTGVSDVHFQPIDAGSGGGADGDPLAVRLRVDGVLHDALTVPARQREEVVGRVKVLGRLDVAEKRLPQDGRATVRVGGRSIDLRIASMPTDRGERVVVRLLDRGTGVLSLEELGFPPDVLAGFRDLVSRQHGMVLVTGPTGSGKSTTLYAALSGLDRDERNVLTLEDPVEHRLPGVSQTQVNAKKGMTFASGLRSVLRQDPDVVMVGEIRDAETAAMAVQSSLTGHLVFSTLHTNDAPGAVARLLDLGVEPYLAAGCLAGVLAQRLVRRVCEACGAGAPFAEADRLVLGLPPGAVPPGATLRRGAGCDACRGTGYRGRFAVCELLSVTEEVADLIGRRAPAAEVRTAAVAAGYAPMRADGLRRVLAGETTPEEVARVTAAG